MRILTRIIAIFGLFLLLNVLFISCREYEYKERIPVEVNTVGPFHNPAESYKYYSLPYCLPKRNSGSDDDDYNMNDDENDNLGEVLAGDRRQPSLYEIRFGVDVIIHDVCQYSLKADEIKAFQDAIRKHYMFELFVDELSVKGFVGEIEINKKRFSDHVHENENIYLFTHLVFDIAKNNGNIIAVNLTTDPNERVLLTYQKPVDVELTYSVHWFDTDVKYIDRQSLHSKSDIEKQPIEIHWLSIINSFVLVLLLTAFLGVILVRVLKKDFARYMELDDEENGDNGVLNSDGLVKDDNNDESGWKLVHGDVFRFPRYSMLLTAALGNGIQILVMIISILLFALLGTFYPGNRGALYTAAVVLYVLSSFVAGYIATYNYIRMQGNKWATNAVLTAALFAGPFFITFSIVNSVAWYYGSSSALPAATIILIISMWLLISFPLTIFGSMKARSASLNTSYDAPCKTNRVEREIPPIVWYRHPILHMLIAGFLPFSAIYIELHYIFTSVWGHRVYTLYGILSLAFIMLIIVTAFITIALTYFQLASEDYHWWWRSYLSGCSCGLFMYGYGWFYYNYRSQMYGPLQATFFFGYMLMISYAFSLMLGSVAFYCAQAFVKHIYRSIKID